MGTLLGIGGSLLGGFLNSKAGEKQQQAAQGMSQADRDFYEKMYKQSLSDNRANQTSDFGSLTWSQDPQTGKWTQTSALNPAEQGRLGDFRQIAADRMNAAKGLSANFAQGATNWDALGMGKIAGAAGVPGGGSSDAIADARSGIGVVGQPSWGAGGPMGPSRGGRQGGFPGGSAGGGFIGGQMPTPQGGPGMGQPPGPAGLPGGRQPYQPAPITPQLPPQVGPPPSAPPPQAPSNAPDPAQQANLMKMLDSGYSQGLSNEMFNHFGGDNMLKEMQKLDPNAKWTDVSVGGGGEGAGGSQTGRRLDFDPRVLAQMLRG